MGYIFKTDLFIVFFVACFAGRCLCIRPKLDVEEEWIFEPEFVDDQSNKPLVITCQSDHPLKWRTQVADSYYSVEDESTRDSYVSTLTIGEPLRDDSGEFECLNELGESASTYVYIDDGEPFVITQSIQYTKVRTGKDIVLNCRTTRPDVQITVLMNNEELPKSKYHFDPRRGVIIKGGNYIGSHVTCKNAGVPPASKTFIIREQTERSLLSPSIDEPRNSFHVAGVPFTLNCTIPLEKGGRATIRWKLPRQTARTKQEHSEHNFPTRLLVSKLTMVDPTPEDSGNYTCIVRQGASAVKTTKTIVVQGNQPSTSQPLASSAPGSPLMPEASSSPNVGGIPPLSASSKKAARRRPKSAPPKLYSESCQSAVPAFDRWNKYTDVVIKQMEKDRQAHDERQLQIVHQLELYREAEVERHAERQAESRRQHELDRRAQELEWSANAQRHHGMMSIIRQQLQHQTELIELLKNKK